MNINIDAFEEKRKKLSQKWSQYPNILWHGSKGIQMADHSLVHTQNLLGLADNLLTLLPKETIKPIEFLILYYALWLHDIGHRGNKNYQEPIDVRDFHGVISGLLLLEDAFKNNSELYELEKSIAVPVALISMYHQRNIPFNNSDRKYLMEETFKPLPKELRSSEQLGTWLSDIFSISSGIPNREIILLSELLNLYKNNISDKEIGEVLNNNKVDLNYLCALLRFIDTIDFRYNKVGTKLEKLARERCIEKELCFYKNKERESNNHIKVSKDVSEDIYDMCCTLKEKWEKKEIKMLRNVDKELLQILKVRKGEYFKEVIEWSKHMRYIAFLKDQVEYYYPLHRSILNVYFAPSENPSNDRFLDIIFDVKYEGISFEDCYKRVMKQIKDEWNVGKSNNEVSVGETLENRGIKIQKYVFKDISGSKPISRCYTFPDGKPTNCQ